MYTAELVTALRLMHEQSIMHRDLKPENVLLDENLHCKIVSGAVLNFRLILATRSSSLMKSIVLFLTRVSRSRLDKQGKFSLM